MRQNYELYLPSASIVCSELPPERKHRCLAPSEFETILADFELYMQNEARGCLWYETPSPELSFQSLLRAADPIEAAGGLVQNAKGDILMIFRLGHWDLPKGKLEKGEEAEEAALREVEEECGIGLLETIGQLPKTYHAYKLENRWLFKTTHWFHLYSPDSGALKPQAEEDIERAEWKSGEELEKALERSWPAISSLVEQFLDEN